MVMEARIARAQAPAPDPSLVRAPCHVRRQQQEAAARLHFVQTTMYATHKLAEHVSAGGAAVSRAGGARLPPGCSARARPPAPAATAHSHDCTAPTHARAPCPVQTTPWSLSSCPVPATWAT